MLWIKLIIKYCVSCCITYINTYWAAQQLLTELMTSVRIPSISKRTHLPILELSHRKNEIFFFHGAKPRGPRPAYLYFTIILSHTTLGMTLLDVGSARHTDLYLTTHNTNNRKTSMPPVGFEPAIPASERLQNHTLEFAAIAISQKK